MTDPPVRRAFFELLYSFPCDLDTTRDTASATGIPKNMPIWLPSGSCKSSKESCNSLTASGSKSGRSSVPGKGHPSRWRVVNGGSVSGSRSSGHLSTRSVRNDTGNCGNTRSNVSWTDKCSSRVSNAKLGKDSIIFLRYGSPSGNPPRNKQRKLFKLIIPSGNCKRELPLRSSSSIKAKLTGKGGKKQGFVNTSHKIRVFGTSSPGFQTTDPGSPIGGRKIEPLRALLRIGSHMFNGLSPSDFSSPWIILR